MTDFKYENFRMKDDTSGIVRWATTGTGIPTMFYVSGYDLSLMRNERSFIDFDQASEKILATLNAAADVKQIAFVWARGVGFVRL